MICKHFLRYTQLKDQTVLFSKSHLFALSLNVKQFYLIHRPNQVLPLQARMDLAVKGYSTFPKAAALQEPHHIV